MIGARTGGSVQAALMRGLALFSLLGYHLISLPSAVQMKWNVPASKKAVGQLLGLAEGIGGDHCHGDTTCQSECERFGPKYLPLQAEENICFDVCCPAEPPPGICYPSGKCNTECSFGFENVDIGVNTLVSCVDLCCTPGPMQAFWYNECYKDCPKGFKSLAKRALCWDLCVREEFHGWVSFDITLGYTV